MSHAPTDQPDWYANLQNDEALTDPSYAEAKHFGREPSVKCALTVGGEAVEMGRVSRSPLDGMKRVTPEERARGLWMDAWFEAMFAKPERPYVMLREKAAYLAKIAERVAA